MIIETLIKMFLGWWIFYGLVQMDRTERRVIDRMQGKRPRLIRVPGLDGVILEDWR